ncbi:uncharacterized protein KY384_002745 [Bacidia gigantensis]|uniref:uncharacterized protein n=1 Tax=Bacidia gigantensis TaxID=2732470 RepID=UPI001D050FBE|nr:uncharacterized protein KY384_002745 [Bacidia gigantensis]KAG8532867.1 hypothetical protein KY384_002745 [Bacidia gigantensis]
MSPSSQEITTPSLSILTDVSTIAFVPPSKKINEGQDVAYFLQSKAYRDIMTFVLQLNRALFPSRTQESSEAPSKIQAWQTGSGQIESSEIVTSLNNLVLFLDKTIEEAPLEPGPRRFGNVAFRRWHQIITDRTSSLFTLHLPNIPSAAHDELKAYFLSSFGNAQRLDYGSGHELSFLAFLACIWKLGGFFPSTQSSPTQLSPSTIADQSRAIVLRVIQPYLQLIRRLITTYTLEPAGSHGVWGLDDHSFLPYIFGSAQLGPPIPSISPTDQTTPIPAPTPTEGSLPSAPDPSSITKPALVEKYKETNMYFSAIAFIHEVKKGPFWEHSPMLYDISGVRGGWGKINKGMLKMYDKEVLGKFPVVQHFPFGSLFSWERDPEAPGAVEAGSVHLASQPSSGAGGRDAAVGVGVQGGTKAPWGKGVGTGVKDMPAPRAGEGTRAPWAGGAGTVNLARMGDMPTMYPAGERKLRDPNGEKGRDSGAADMPPPTTRAPWAKPP